MSRGRRIPPPTAYTVVYFHCASGLRYGPSTCRSVRLLGPCFKTGRKEPFSHQSAPKWVQLSTFTHPRAGYHVPRVFPKCGPQMTRRARSTARVLLKTPYHACAEAGSHRNGTQQSRSNTLAPFASLSAISGTFNSLFKVLFTFPSWYLFAIGLEPMFSFR